MEAYYKDVLAQFDVFYTAANLLRETLLQQLQLSDAPNESSISLIPVLQSPSLMQFSSSFFPLPTSIPLKEAVCIANSLLGDRCLVMEGKWLISLIYKIDSPREMFLLLEGVREGIPIHLRKDFFLDAHARSKILSRLQPITSSAIAMVSSISSDLGEYGFRDTTLPSVEEYEKTWGGYQYQSWFINEGQAEQFMARLVKELQDSPLLPSPVTLESEVKDTPLPNSREWCQTILTETFNIKITLQWFPAKRPEVLARSTTGTPPLLPESLLPNVSRMSPTGNANALALLRSIMDQSRPGNEGGAPPFLLPPLYYQPQ